MEKTKLQLAQDITDRNINLFTDRYQRIYPFTTENVAAYTSLFDLQDKSLLTVGSSLDQAINAALCGCTDITVLDLCPFTREYFYLKKAAIKTLSKEEFERFFAFRHYRYNMFDNNKPFDKDLFEILSQQLKEEDQQSYDFWSQLFTTRRRKNIRKNLFSYDEHRLSQLRISNLYMQDEESYQLTRHSLDAVNISFETGNILTHPISRTYDNIFLSNIASTYDMNEIDKLLEITLPHLSEEGQLLICYIYSLTRDLAYYDGEPPMYHIRKMLEYLPPSTELYSLPSVHDRANNDAVYVYKNKK